MNTSRDSTHRWCQLQQVAIVTHMPHTFSQGWKGQEPLYAVPNSALPSLQLARYLSSLGSSSLTHAWRGGACQDTVGDVTQHGSWWTTSPMSPSSEKKAQWEQKGLRGRKENEQ